MLKRRIVPCLDVRDGRVVKGVRFEGLRDAGDPAELAERYAEAGADELVFLDVTATRRDERTAVALAGRVAARAFIPFTVGGGLRTVEDMRRVLHAGADKVGINTAAVRRPSLISEAAERFGSQAVVVAIDAYQAPAGDGVDAPDGARGRGDAETPDGTCGRDGADARTPPRWRVRVTAGTEDTPLDAVEWATRAAELGAGEILLTSIDRDGTKDGYDLELLRAVCGCVGVPVIASGGAGRPRHFREAFEAGASAALAASLFHFRELEIPDLKRWLAARGVPVRPVEA